MNWSNTVRTNYGFVTIEHEDISDSETFEPEYMYRYRVYFKELKGVVADYDRSTYVDSVLAGAMRLASNFHKYGVYIIYD